MKDYKIGVVVVTYNRLDKLKETLSCYEKQTYQPHCILVVNNSSTDGTKEFLTNEWRKSNTGYKKVIVNCDTNIGGAGGFALGMEKIQEYDSDFVFIADDDAFAAHNCFELLVNYYDNYDKKEEIGAVCTSVINCGEFATGHRRIVKKGLFTIKEESVSDESYNLESFEFDQVSFVGAMFKTSVVKQIGVPISEYFIQYDDIEYSTRVRNSGYKMVCVPKSRMDHNTGAENIVFSWKNYYSARNRMHFAKRYFSKVNYYFYYMDFWIRNCSIISLILKKRTLAEVRMFKKAIQDANNNVFGISDVYKPGTDIERL